MFPDVFKSPPVPATLHTNIVYKGWHVKLDRLFFANGARETNSHIPSTIWLMYISGDPWRDATVSAEGLNVRSTSSQPIALSDGFHCSDLSYRNALVDPTIDAVQKQALASIKTWLAAWTPGKATAHPFKRDVSDEGDAGSTFNPPVNVWFRDPGVM